VGDAAGRDAGGSGRFQGFGLNPYDLIGQQSVQQSLNLSQQQLVRLQELMQQQQQQGQLLQNPNAAQIAQQQALQQQQQQQALQQQQLQQGSGFGGNNFDPSQFREFLQPNQFSRFQQIRLQQNPFMLLEDRGISAELALSDEQVRQVQAIERDVRRDIRRLYRERPDDFGTRLNALRSGVFDNLQNVLDQDQRVIWQQLLGEQFAGQIDYRLTR
jgi:archaellum component FlaC